jgi:very-short-patch-repair endonuclease
MARNFIIPYNHELKQKARLLRTKCTPSETLLWSKIRKKALGYEFHRQVPIDEFIVDFYCHELNLAIEVDGSSHERKHDYDFHRQRTLEGLGIRVIRFDNEDINKGLGEVVRILANLISELERGV